MNPLDLSDRATGLMRLLAMFVGMAFIGWVIYVNISGPSAIAQLEDFEERALETQQDYLQEQRAELRDTMLRDDGWGSETARASIEGPTTPAELSREYERMRDAEEGGWGVQ